jgi:hypothetical protein
MTTPPILRKGPSGPPDDSFGLPDPSLSPGNLVRAKADGTAYEFLETPSNGNIAQFNSTSGAYQAAEGPGPIQPLSFDADAYPASVDEVWTYQFPDLDDKGPNGIDLELGGGTVFETEMVPGSPCLYFNDDGGHLQSVDATPTAAQRADNIALLSVIMFDQPPNNLSIVSIGAAGELQDENVLYRHRFPTINPPRNQETFWEFDTGDNVNAATTVAGSLIPSLASVHVPMFVATVRSIIAGQAFVQHYLEGSLFGPLLGPFTPPNGGSSGRLFIGGDQGVGAASRYLHLGSMLMASATYEFTATDIMRERNRVMGRFYGELPLP